MYTDLQAKADVARTGTSDPNLIESTMEQAGVDEVTNMEENWWSTIYCQQILLGMLTIFGPIQWAFSLLPKWESSWAKWLIRYLTVHFYGAMLYFVSFRKFVNLCVSVVSNFVFSKRNKSAPKLC